MPLEDERRLAGVAGTTDGAMAPGLVRSHAIRGAQLILLRRGLGFVVNFGTTVAIVRIAGLRVWGIIAVGLFLLTVVQNGLRWGNTIFLVQRPASPTDEETDTVFTFQMAISLALCALLFGFAGTLARHYRDLDLRLLCSAVGVSALPYGVSSVARAKLDRDLQYGKSQAIDMADTVVFCVVSVAGIAGGYGVTAVAFAIVLKALVSAILAFAFAPGLPSLRVCPSVARQVLGFGASISAFVWIGLLNNAVMPVLLGSSVGVEGIGFVELGYRLLNYPKVISSTGAWIASTALPRLQQSLDLFSLGTQKVLFGSMFILIPALLFLVGLSPWWIPIVYGSRWRVVAPVLLWGALGAVLESLATTVAYSLFAIGKWRAQVKYLALYTTALWCLTFVLIRRFGYLGFPIAYLLASLAGFYLVAHFQREIGPLQFARLGTILIFFPLACGAAWWLASSAHIWIAAAICVGSAGLFMTGWREQRQLLQEILRLATSGLQLPCRGGGVL